MSFLKRMVATRASIAETIIVVGVVVLAWRFFLGWNWATEDPAGNPGPWADTNANIRHAVYASLVAFVCVVWISLRGRPLLGPGIMLVVIACLSGWRIGAAAAAEPDNDGLWPVGLAIGVMFGSAVSALVLGLATVGRQVFRRRLGVN